MVFQERLRRVGKLELESQASGTQAAFTQPLDSASLSAHLLRSFSAACSSILLNSRWEGPRHISLVLLYPPFKRPGKTEMVSDSLEISY